MKHSIKDLIEKIERWEIKEDKVIVYEHTFPLVHPALIHLKLYRIETNPEIRFRHMKAAHDYIWPKEIETWHSWSEERFREHCAGWSYITWAGGASCGKSVDGAKIALLFWFANPKNRAVIVASTTLESLNSRVFGYITNLISKKHLELPSQHMGGNSPKILYPVDRTSGEIRDNIHGIFAIAAKQGSDENAINTWIGRHPNESLLLVLDECTDLNSAISKAFVNLDSSEKPFQCIGIGNSNSWNDLHGMMSTPKDGIGSIDPMVHTKWETTRKNGICMFFSCYNSPAIHDPDPVKRKRLGRFLITDAQIKEKEKIYGKHSDAFYRFVLGFWRSSSTDKVIASKAFLDANDVVASTEWLGIRPLHIVAGLDPAFSTGGDQCILRLGVVGENVDGAIVLDFRNEELLFRLPILATSRDPAEIQIAKQVQKILGDFNCPLHHVCMDATGQGRALGGTIYLQMNALKPPIKVYNIKHGEKVVDSFDCLVMSPYDMWYTMREFIEHGQIKGLDHKAFGQFTQRLTMVTDKKGNPCKPYLEPKLEYKRRMAGRNPALAHSPDEADSAALCLQSAIINYGFSLGQRVERVQTEDFVSQKMFAYKREQKEEASQSQTIQIGSGFGLGMEVFARKSSFLSR